MAVTIFIFLSVINDEISQILFNCPNPFTDLNLEQFLTRRLAFSKKRTFSRFIIGIATAAVALSITVMIVAVSLVNGFQQEVSDKIYGFWGHIVISKYGFGQRFEEAQPINVAMLDATGIKTIPNIRHVQVTGYKPGIIKANDAIEGIVLKGVSADFDWTYFKKYLIEGDTLTIGLEDSLGSRGLFLSQITSRRLGLSVGDNLEVHFIRKVPLVRKFKVAGIYNTGLEEFDEKFAMVDMKIIQNLNGWTSGQVGGVEVFVNNYQTNDILLSVNEKWEKYFGSLLFDITSVDPLTATNDDIYYDVLGGYPELMSQTLKEIEPNIFDWLSLQNLNKYIILILMGIVALINMTTCILILILERTNMIGILKALGATNAVISRMFLVNGAIIMGLGILIGNILGIGLCLAQQHFGFITLPPESYYVTSAPVDLNYTTIFVINLLVFVFCEALLFIPSLLVSRISPIKAIRFS
jgi:lipoprotein-releasing system permease protein